jgi:hypothetical protein
MAEILFSSPSSLHEKKLMTNMSEATKKEVAENAKKYVSFLMSTFAQVMLDARGRSEDHAQDMAESTFFADTMGEALCESDMGRDLQQTLQASMLEMAATGGRP